MGLWGEQVEDLKRAIFAARFCVRRTGIGLEWLKLRLKSSSGWRMSFGCTCWSLASSLVDAVNRFEKAFYPRLYAFGSVTSV